MGSFFLELSMFGAIIVLLTAFSAVIVQFFGANIFGRKSRKKFVVKSESIQNNWNYIGGKQE